jgi:hypothetical protein
MGTKSTIRNAFDQAKPPVAMVIARVKVGETNVGVIMDGNG